MATGAPLLSSVDARLEAALFAAGRPVTEAELGALLPEGIDVNAVLRRVADFWSERGIRVQKGGDGWTMRPERKLLPDAAAGQSRKLSEAAIATLAVVAMHQPVTIGQIEKVRGVKLARGIIESLEASGLIAQAGRRRGTGRAVSYVVTARFLERFDIASLSDLPTPEEAFMLDLEAPQATEPGR